MRLSTLDGDPGYDPVLAPTATVTLNGIVQTACFTADEEEGIVLRYLRDENGKFVLDESGFPRREMAVGKVVITLKEPE